MLNGVERMVDEVYRGLEVGSVIEGNWRRPSF